MPYRAHLEGKGERRRFTPVSFSQATNASHQVVAGESGVIIRVVHIMLVAEGDVGVQYRSGSNNLTGVMDLAANVGFVDHPGPDSPLDMNSGEAFNIYLSAAQQVSGYVLYYKEAA